MQLRMRDVAVVDDEVDTDVDSMFEDGDDSPDSPRGHRFRWLYVTTGVGAVAALALGIVGARVVTSDWHDQRRANVVAGYTKQVGQCLDAGGTSTDCVNQGKQDCASDSYWGQDVDSAIRYCVRVHVPVKR